MFFLLSAAQSLGILALLGKLPAQALTSGALLIPFLVVGFLVSGPLRRFLDGGRVRGAILVLAGVSALSLIAESAWG